MMIEDLQLKHMKELVTQERAGVGWALVVDFPPSSTLGCSVFDRAEGYFLHGETVKSFKAHSYKSSTHNSTLKMVLWTAKAELLKTARVGCPVTALLIRHKASVSKGGGQRQLKPFSRGHADPPLPLQILTPRFLLGGVLHFLGRLRRRDYLY